MQEEEESLSWELGKKKNCEDGGVKSHKVQVYK